MKFHEIKLFSALILIFLILGCSNLSSASSEPAELRLGDASFSVNVTVYNPESDTKKSLLIIPPTGGTNIIDRSYAKQFRKAGYRVYILNSWTDDNENSTDIEIHQRFYGRAQKAIGLVLKEIKTPFVGMIGTSVGALHASISAATVPNLNAVFSIVGGAPIAEVVVTSDQQAMKDLRDARKVRYGYKTDQDNIKAIGAAFTLEPMQQGDLYKHKSLGMTLAQHDDTVTYLSQEQLRNYWQPRTVITLPSNHFWGIVKMWLFHSDELEKFFEDSAAKFI